MGFGESRVQGLGLGVETVLGSGFRIWGIQGTGCWGFGSTTGLMTCSGWHGGFFLNFRKPIVINEYDYSYYDYCYY